MEKKKAKKEDKVIIWYSMHDIVRGKMFPHYRSFYSIRKIVQEDMKGKNILKPITKGTGTTKRYLFKGENINKFIKAIEAGKVQY